MPLCDIRWNGETEDLLVFRDMPTFYLGEEPSSKHHPIWSEEVGTWKLINSGVIHIWEGELDPGIHTVVCASPKHGIWHGGGFEVDY